MPKVSFAAENNPKRLAVQQAFGKMLREARDKVPVSQYKIGVQCKLSRQTIMSYEWGMACPNLYQACELAHALGMNLDTLLKAIDPEYTPFDQRTPEQE